MAVLGCSISLISITSCASLERRVEAAAAIEGQAKARVTLPPAPAELGRKEPHAELAVGMEIRTALKLERAALERANARLGRWAAFYAALRAALK
jgi:hypothetical protein